ncbi:unnamed protein product [Microthlaspi erraticum]|uniref:DRBM domain-containing protein n=1 Tax=Microthlaspi erraticum TaxID=1685480 RepID=A0A6D2KUJ0_9BRAS|nr:unnamed protein product [Microthlaspi erraticum]
MACEEEKQTLTPKEIIHEKFGAKASYRIEQVQASSPPKAPFFYYRCHLQLPEFSVVSNVFKNKKDSEQSAAELALEKLGIHPQDDDDDDDSITVEQAWDDIAQRLKHIFSDKFLSADHPLASHIRAIWQRDGERCGSVPVSVISAFDETIISRCEVIDPSVGSDPVLAMSYVIKAAAMLCDYIVLSSKVDAFSRINPNYHAIVKPTHVGRSVTFKAVYIRCTIDGEEVVEPITLAVSPGQYYLDVIAEKLGLEEGGLVLISRTVGKNCRVYSAISKLKTDNSWKADGKRPVAESSHLEKTQNAKASLVCGQDVHGDAIVASVGYMSHGDLEHDDVTLKSFYRICCGVSPNGIYKLSRQALIAAQLPFSFTRQSSWRGPLPKEILSMFCRQQQLSEPVFTISTTPVKPLSDLLRSFKKLKDSDATKYNEYNMKRRGKERVLSSGYRCEVKILSKSQDLVLDCSPGKLYRKEDDAIQNASLKALSWFSSLFDDLDADAEQPRYTSEDLDWMFERNVMIRGAFPSSEKKKKLKRYGGMYGEEDKKRVQTIQNGFLVTIGYSVSVEVDADFSKNGKGLREVVESSKEMEFEVGNGSMNAHLESVVTQMSVGQSACFFTNMPAEELVIAAANDSVRTRSLLSGNE